MEYVYFIGGPADLTKTAMKPERDIVALRNPIPFYIPGPDFAEVPVNKIDETLFFYRKATRGMRVGLHICTVYVYDKELK